MQPHTGISADVSDRVERIDRAGIDIARCRDDAYWMEAGGAIGADLGGERAHIHLEGIGDGHRDDRIAPDTEH